MLFLKIAVTRTGSADSQIRNSGPFIGGKSFGTHNAVKIFYSPEVWDWLKHRNRQGNISDGGIIVKEMFPSPAKADAKLSGWTAMVKDKNGSYDGWYLVLPRARLRPSRILRSITRTQALASIA